MKQDDVVRQTMSLPQDAVEFLDRVARYNFTSRNAEVVRAIRERMAATGDSFAGDAPAAAQNETARQSGPINTHAERTSAHVEPTYRHP